MSEGIAVEWDEAEPEERLPGGNVTGATRVGQTVRRPTRPWSPSVHVLLNHLESVGFEGAPRFHGIDAQGREILDFIEGTVPSRLDPSLLGSEEVVFGVGALIRRLHSAAESFDAPANSIWRFREGRPGPGEIVCHGDLSPWNLVMRLGRPFAFIDWDFACPRTPLSDVAQAAVHFAPLESDEECRAMGWEEPPRRRQRIRALCDGYELARSHRDVLLDEAIRVMERAHNLINTSKDPDMVKLRELGIGELPLGNIQFIQGHRKELET